MRVLLTNNTLDTRAGSELYIYDVAVELLNRGHQPIAFSTVLGPVAERLREATVPVVDDLALLASPPDVIHGHHHFETLLAALTFPGVPTLNFCHGWIAWEEQPLIFPSVRRYVAVDDVCRDRLQLEHGIGPERISVLLNFVDTKRFRPRSPLPAAPRRALAFGNLFTNDGPAEILRTACEEEGIELDVAGLHSGRSLEKPEIELGRYDLVFAKGRAALEAMAVGAAVILCGPRGLGPAVTTEEWDRLRRQNFGLRALTLPIVTENVRTQIRRYDPRAAAAVSVRVRSEASLSGAVDELLRLYEDAIRDNATVGFNPALDGKAAAQHLRLHAPAIKGRAAQVAIAQDQLLQAECALDRANQHVEQVEDELEVARARLLEERERAVGFELELARFGMHYENSLTELNQIRNSATWRIARGVLQSPIFRFLNPLFARLGGTLPPPRRSTLAVRRW